MKSGARPMLDLEGVLFDPATRRLLCGQDERKLSPKAAAVLLALGETPGQVWSRDALLERVWPNVHVGEEVLTHAIAEIRRALGDDFRRPRLLETVHKSGYRLLAAMSAPKRRQCNGEEVPSTPPCCTRAERRDRPAVAVLPFVNIGDGQEHEHLADGLAEELIIVLGKWRAFPVVARNSSFAFRGAACDTRKIAHELSATYVVEGSIRVDGERMRASARLVDGASGLQLWANNFDSEWRQVLELQEALAREVGAALGAELGLAEQLASIRRTCCPTAWDLQLKGRAALQLFSADGNAHAREFFTAAIELDQHYSDAYAGLATANTRDRLLNVSPLKEQGLANALKAARQAVRLDPLSAVAREALSTTYIWLGEETLAIAEARSAAELNPSDASVVHGLGNKSDLAGDSGGLALMVRAQLMNPRDPDRHAHLCFLARAYTNAGRHEEAARCAREAVSRRPDYPHAHYILAVALGHLGRIDEAAASLDRCDVLQSGFVASRSRWAPYAASASNERLAAGLRRAQQLRQPGRQPRELGNVPC